MLLSRSGGLYHAAKINSNCILTLSSSYSNAAGAPENVPEPLISSKQVAQFRRGTGGRAGYSGNVITVFGATGYIGRGLVSRLAKYGNQIIIPYRCDPYWVRELKVFGDLGQILFFPFHLKDEEAIRKAVKYSNVVINLIGTRVNTKQFSMYDTHEHGGRRIARISREMGVERLIHVSAMNADPNYQSVVRKNLDFLKSKGVGELAVREEFPSATIIRPAIIHGDFDQFIFPMLRRFRKNPLDWVKLYKAGEETYKMPIYINDVTMGINKAVTDPTSAGKTYEFVGPHCYKLGHLVDYMYAKARVTDEFRYTYYRHGHFDPWFFAMEKLCALYSKVYRVHFQVNMEWIEFIEGASDVLTGVPTIADLGIQRLAEFEDVGGYNCYYNSYIRAYEERYGEVKEPPLPLRSPPLYKGKPRPQDVHPGMTKKVGGLIKNLLANTFYK